MPRGSDIEQVVEHLVRLRRAIRHGDSETRRDLEPVVTYFEGVVGPTLSRANTARLLGVSYPALDRWIAKGDIAALRTPSGKREVPLSQVVDLKEQLQAGEDVTLADVIRDRRRKAAAIPEDEFLPRRRRRPRTHRIADLRSLSYHRLVARRLDDELVGEALRRLDLWEQSGRIDPRWASVWRQILDKPIAQIAREITVDTDRGRAFRQSSPFAGALNEHERQRIAHAVEELVQS